MIATTVGYSMPRLLYKVSMPDLFYLATCPSHS